MIKPQAILIGRPDDSFTKYAAGIMDKYDIDHIRVDNIYLATVILAKADIETSLIIGRLEDLTLEQGRFTDRTSGSAWCLALQSDASSHRIKTANQRNVILLNNPNQLEVIINKLLGPSVSTFITEKKSQKTQRFRKENFAATKAELQALLEDDSDV